MIDFKTLNVRLEKAYEYFVVNYKLTDKLSLAELEMLLTHGKVEMLDLAHICLPIRLFLQEIAKACLAAENPPVRKSFLEKMKRRSNKTPAVNELLNYLRVELVLDSLSDLELGLLCSASCSSEYTGRKAIAELLRREAEDV